jgi:hypothetical protein
MRATGRYDVPVVDSRSRKKSKWEDGYVSGLFSLFALYVLLDIACVATALEKKIFIHTRTYCTVVASPVVGRS